MLLEASYLECCPFISGVLILLKSKRRKIKFSILYFGFLLSFSCFGQTQLTAMPNLDLTCMANQMKYNDQQNYYLFSLGAKPMTSNFENELFVFGTELPVFKKLRISEVLLFPNPADNYFEWRAKYKLKSIAIISGNGQYLISVSYPKNIVDISFLKAGVYYVEFEKINSEKIIQKLIVL